jgi:hypothetical protein
MVEQGRELFANLPEHGQDRIGVTRHHGVPILGDHDDPAAEACARRRDLGCPALGAAGRGEHEQRHVGRPGAALDVPPLLQVLPDRRHPRGLHQLRGAEQRRTPARSTADDRRHRGVGYLAGQLLAARFDRGRGRLDLVGEPGQLSNSASSAAPGTVRPSSSHRSIRASTSTMV